MTSLHTLSATELIPLIQAKRVSPVELMQACLDRAERLQPLVDDGLVRIEPDRIVSTSRGRLLLRNIAMCFDHYLDQPAHDQPATPRFSRAI